MSWPQSVSGASLAASKWSADVAMSSSSKCKKSCVSAHCPMTSTPPFTSSVPDLPLPVVQKKPKSVRINSVSSQWAHFKSCLRKTLSSPSAASSSGLEETVYATQTSHTLTEFEGDIADDAEVDEIVVDRSWSDCDMKSSSNLDGDDASSVISASGVLTDREGPLLQPRHWSHYCVLSFFRLRACPCFMEFFSSKFEDEKKEAHYQSEVWTDYKTLSLWSAVFFLVNWILGIALIQGPVVMADRIFYYGIATALTVPIIFFCAYNFPRDHAVFYQIFLCISVWSWSFYQVIFAVMCGKYDATGNGFFTCGSKDFLSTFYYTSALQTIALFGAGLKRFPALVGATVFLVTCLSLTVRSMWIRNIVDFIVYQGVLLYMHYRREHTARRLYALRVQLKLQFQRTQKAQINERKTADSKRRLTSYVRVPLNTALLAVQNMEASGTIAKDQEIEFSALEGSLNMMSKVLNDVLDFNRMDSGRLESLSKPYAFHQVMKSMFMPLRLATNARNLEFVTDLDMNIDEVARRAQYEAMGESEEDIVRHLKEEPSGDSAWGIVAGDETRLRQIVTNLASNACKFTPSGGKLTISTRLVLPSGSGPDQHTKDCESPNTLSTAHLSQHNGNYGMPIKDRIVVRIEVTDSGWGIRAKDMEDNKLFSAFNQTEQGRLQGGKGTGLGLALVRQIVTLTKGRLGVRSKIGVGSTFWVELPLGVGRKAMSCSGPPLPAHAGPTSPTLQEIFHDTSRTLSSGSMDSNEDKVSPPKFLKRTSQSLRTPSALHGLMDQGGSVELVLAKYESHSPVPTRTLGDISTGTEYPILRSPVDPPDDPFPLPASKEGPSEVAKPRVTSRPTYVPLPSPRSFPLDGPDHLTPSSSSPLASPPISRQNALFDQEVLVVDDDPLTRTLMKRMLTRIGCTVSTAENGDVALGILLGSAPTTPSTMSDSSGPTLDQPHEPHEKHFSVVFMDNQMPIMSGLKAISKLRAAGRDDFVVGITGNALLADQNEYLEAGVDHVLTKPVLERSIKVMLSEACQRGKTPSIVEGVEP